MSEFNYKARNTFYILKDAVDQIKRIWEREKFIKGGETISFLDIVKREVSGVTPEYIKDLDKFLSRKHPMFYD